MLRSERRAAAPAVQARLAHLRPTRARVDLDAVAANYLHLVERARGAAVLCVVKADAYGHGAVAVSRRLAREGARWFGVALVEEGLELREAGIEGTILLLGGASPEQLGLALDQGLTPTVVSRESLDDLVRFARERGAAVDCHVKVDTGMTRLGLAWDEFSSFVPQLAASDAVRVTGLLTHLSCSDDPAVPFTRIQLERFRACRRALEAASADRPLVHVASSAGLLTRAEREVALVRPGLALYGLNPFGNVPAPELTPALTLASEVSRVAAAPAGTAVGYGGSFITVRDSVLATIPVGYDDGLPRALSDDWEVVVRGRLVPLVGRVSMDLCVADVTDVPGVAVGDEVVVAGGVDTGAHPFEAMAHRLRTIAYECVTGISGRVPRVYFEDGVARDVHSRFECLDALRRAPAAAGDR